MCLICPTVTAYNPHDYRQEIERVSSFARRLHIDLMDEEFTGVHSVTLPQAWWPHETAIDLHIMFDRPALHLETLKTMLPDRVIFHAEAKGDLTGFADNLRKYGMSPGVAFLQGTDPQDHADLLRCCDHALIFSGKLGHHGGKADLSLLTKVQQIRSVNANCEVSWDGGINDLNALELKQGGVDVLNVGGFIQKADDPHAAFNALTNIVR